MMVWRFAIRPYENHCKKINNGEPYSSIEGMREALMNAVERNNGVSVRELLEKGGKMLQIVMALF